jgi:hypothetical protein
MVEEKIKLGIFKKDILAYLKKENGKVKGTSRFYSKNPNRNPEDHPYEIKYQFSFPLNNQKDDTGLHLNITVNVDFNEESLRVCFAGIYYKEAYNMGIRFVEMDEEAKYKNKDFKNIEKKVMSFINFLEVELDDDFFDFNHDGIRNGRWYDSFEIYNQDFAGSELVDRKCIEEAISNSYEFNKKDREKLNILLNNEKLFIKLLQNCHAFNYKKVFSEMDAFGENEWKNYVALNYSN